MEDEDWLYEDSSGDANVSCDKYQSDRYRNLAMIAASMGVVSLVASLLVILVILVLKKYQVFMQRLILYLCIVIAINAVSLILRFSRADYKNHNNRNLDNLCIAAAFFDQTTRWSMTIAYTCLTFTLLIAVTFNSSGQVFELGYIFAIFLLPLMFNWIPFIHNTYGEAGAWCWIRTKNEEMVSGVIENCTNHELGKVLTYVLWYVPNYILLGVVFILYIIAVIMLVRNSRHWKGVYSTGIDSRQEREKMKELVMPIIFYPLVFFVLNIFPLVNRVYETFSNDPNYILWLLHAIFSPLQGGFVAVLYALDKETIRRLSARECLAYLLHRRTKIDEYPATRERTDSFEHLVTGEGEAKIAFRKYGSTASPTSSGKQEHDITV